MGWGIYDDAQVGVVVAEKIGNEVFTTEVAEGRRGSGGLIAGWSG